MKIKTFILTFLLVMSCPFLFGQSRTVTAEVRSFNDLDEAIKAASTDQDKTANILLKRDIEFSKRIVIPEDVKVYIDINGFNLTCTGDYAFQNEGELTIEDNGNYDSEYGWSVARIKSTGIMNAYKGKATLTLNNVIVESNSQSGVVINNKEGGSVFITNGEIIAKGEANVIQNNGYMAIEDAVVRSEYRIVIGKGSQLKLHGTNGTKIYDPNGAYRYDGGFYTAEQINAMNNPNNDPNIPNVITEEEGSFFVKALLGTIPFSTLKDAVDYAVANNGKVVDLLYNDVETDIVEITAPITINGNNKTLTSTAAKAIDVNVTCTDDEVVTINNLTIATTDNANFRTERAINVINDANLELNNVSAEGFKYTINVINNGAGSTITTNGGKYSGYAAVNITANNTTFTSNDTEFVGVNNVEQHESNNFAAIAVNYPTTENVTININGGKVSATSTTGNRQFIATVENTTKSTITINAELAPIDNDIFNGDFEGENTIAFRDGYADKLLAQGYTFEGVEGNEGLVAVTGIAIAKIDDTYYTSLKEALVAVANNQTIEIVANNDEGSITYPIKDDVVYGTDEEYANNFDITTKEGFVYEFAESSYKLVFTNGVKVTFDNANIKGIVNSFGNETEITLAGNNNIKTLQSSNGGTYSVAEGEQKIGTLQGELKVSGEPKLAINAAGVGSKLVINKATLNGELPANIDVVAQGKNNIINTAIKGGNFVVAENAAVEVNADMTDLASFYFNNGAAVTVNEDSEFTVGTVEVAKDAVVTLNFNGNASFKSTTNDGTINLYMKEGTTFTTKNIDDTDDTDGVSFVATTDENCEIFYEEGAYKAIRILNDGDVAMIGKVGYPTLQAAIDACTTPGDYTIVLLRDIAETSVEIDQTKDINITIDGGEETRYNFSGTMCIHGKSNYTYTETLKIKNIDFYNENLTAAHDFISSNDAHDGHVRYAHNVTIENCNFSVPAETEYDVVAMRFRQAFNISVIGGEFKNLHSVMWTTGTSGVKFDGIAATDCKNGMHIGGGSNGVIVNNSSLDVENYGIRAEGQGKDFSIDGSTIKATIPVVVRKTNEVGSPNFTFGDNTMTPNNSYNYWFVAGIEEYEGGETLPTIAGQVVVNIEEDSNLSYEGVYGSYCVAKIGETQYQSLELALQAVKDGQTIEIIAEGTESNVVYPAADAEEGKYAKEFAIKSVGEGANYQVSVLFQKDVNVDLTDAVIYDLRSFEDAVISLNNTTVNGMLYSKNNKAEVTGGNVTINKLYSEDGQDGAIKVTGTTNLVVKQNIGNPIINMTDVTLGETTSLAAGFKVVFENTNTVNNTSLKGNIVFNNGTTTFDGASLTGSVNVKEGAIVNFTKNTYLNTTGNGQSVIVAGTLKINASGAWATTVNVAETGELNIEGRNEIDNTFLDNNDLNVGTTITNNGTITVNGSNVIIGTANNTTYKLDGQGTLTIAGTAKVDASKVAKVNIANTIELNGADAKFYAPAGLTNVVDAAGIQEPTYIEEEEDGDGYYYSLGGTYVAEIVKDGKTYQFRTIKSALASDHFNGEITLINDTKEDNFNINKTVIFKTEPDSTIDIKSKAWVTANKTLTIAEGANIQFNYLTNVGTVTNKGKLVVKATLENQGTFTNNATITAETLVNAADVTFTNNGTIEAATVTNYGTISNAADKTLTVNDTLTNNGTITNDGSLTATTFTNGDKFINNSGIATLVSVSNNGTINNYATLNVTEFTANVNDGVQLYAGSINVENSLSEIGGNFVVYSTTLDNETKLQGANIIFANGEESSINGATLTNSTLNVNINHTLTINSDLDIASLELAYNKLTYYPYTESFSEVNVSGTLTAATVTNHATLNVTDGSLETTTLTNESTGTITNDGTITANTNGIENSGTLTNKGTLTAAKVTNEGTINNVAGSYKLTVNGTLTNNGTITNGGSLTVGSASYHTGELTNTGTLENIGTLTINSFITNSGTLTNSGSITNYGKLTNKGTLNNNGTDVKSATIKVEEGLLTNDQNATLSINQYAELTAGGNVTNNGAIKVNGTFKATGTSATFTKNGTVNVEGTSAVINIANSVSGTGDFNMTNVKLTTGSKLTNANIVFVEGTYYSQKSSEISEATLTNSKLTVNGYHTLDVTADLALGNSGTLENEGTVIVNEGVEASFGTVTNSNVIKVLKATLKATSSFTNNGTVNVEGTSKLSATVSGTGTFEMKNVSLDGDTKLTDANIKFSNKDNQVTSSVLTDSKVTVNSDAELTLDGATTGDITNNGTLNLTGEVKAGSVTNSGTIKMNTDQTKFYTQTKDLTITPDCTGDVVVYNVEGGYYYINSTRVAKVDDVEYSSLQAAIVAAGENGTVTIIAEEITESVTVSNNTTFELSTDITAATINGKLTVDGTAEFNCAKIQFTNVDLSAGATMIIEEGNFEATSFATKGQKAKINVGVDAKLAMEVLRVQHSGASFEFNGEVNIAQVIADNNTNPYTIKLNAHDARLYTPTTGLNVTTDFVDNEYLTTSEGKNHRVSYKTEGSYYRLVNMLVAKVAGESTTVFTTIEEALALGGNLELLWEEGNDPIVMTGVLTNKNATITANSNNDSDMVVDWSEGRLYIGRMAAFNNGPATLTFDGVKFTSVNDTDADYGIFVSGRVKNSEHYNGTLVIKDSEVEISSIYNQNNTEIENSTVTFKTAKGVVVSGINAGDSPTGDMTTSTLDINNSTVNVENITVGERGVGRVLVDVDLVENEFTPDNNGKSQITVSTLNVLANGILLSAGDIDGTIINAGRIQLCGGIYTMQPQEGWCAENYGAFQLPSLSWIVRETGGTQTTEFAEGWHWYSTYIDEVTLGDVQEQLLNYASQIKSQVAFTTNFGTSWSTGGLNTFSPAEMYMINVTKQGTLEFSGDFVDYSNTDIELQKNWNWIGYPVNIEVNVNVALKNLQPEYGDQIKGKNGFAFYRGEAIGWMPSNLTLLPGNGYMYHSNSDATKTFVYNAVEAEEEGTETRATEVKRWNADATQYPSNMTMIAMVSMDGEVVNGNYEVAAFANGELRGSARPIYVEDLDAYMLFLSINGDEVEELTFKYYDVNYGTEYVLNNRINYSTDAMLGSMDEPYMLTLDILNIDEAAANEISIYPNPTTTNVEINLNATCDTVEVFNALGVKVAEYSNVDSIDALETAGVYVIRITNDGNVQNCRLVVK